MGNSAPEWKDHSSKMFCVSFLLVLFFLPELCFPLKGFLWLSSQRRRILQLVSLFGFFVYCLSVQNRTVFGKNKTKSVTKTLAREPSNIFWSLKLSLLRESCNPVWGTWKLHSKVSEGKVFRRRLWRNMWFKIGFETFWKSSIRGKI